MLHYIHSDSTKLVKHSIMPQKVSFQDIPTECVPFTESAHGKQRRDERNIGISQLQTAMKHGD